MGLYDLSLYLESTEKAKEVSKLWLDVSENRRHRLENNEGKKAMIDQLAEIAKQLEARMFRIDKAMGSMSKDHHKFSEYVTAANELDEAITDIRSAINHIHCSMADKIIWELDSQELRG